MCKQIKNEHSRTYIPVNKTHSHWRPTISSVTRTVHARTETVNAKVCMKLHRRDEEIVLSTTLIKLVYLHTKFLVTFRSSASPSSRGRGGRPLYLALTGMCGLFVSEGDWEEGKKKARGRPPRACYNQYNLVYPTGGSADERFSRSGVSMKRVYNSASPVLRGHLMGGINCLINVQ